MVDLLVDEEAERRPAVGSAPPDRAELVDRLGGVRNWACLLAVVPPRDLEAFELLVLGPEYAERAPGHEVVAQLRTEHCLVVALLPLGALLRRLGEAERAHARWSRWRRVQRDLAASMGNWRAELVREVRRIVDSGFDGVYLDDLDVPLPHVGRTYFQELVREARCALPDHLLLAQAVDWLPGDVTFDALGPPGPLAPSTADDPAAEWWVRRAGSAAATVDSLAAARLRRDITEPWRRDARHHRDRRR